ncbi:MAG: NAD-dependent epimerase/dehydratase family protein [Planctomycetota bacterium]
MKAKVLVTGVSGFIAKHVALRLLQEGYRVHGTVRSASREAEVRNTLAAHGADTAGLTFAHADLLNDEGWGEAVAGCEFVQHLASPFPIRQPRDREELVQPAREGTLRVLNAARDAGVQKVVVTSSMVAMMYRANRPPEFSVGESDWTDPEWRRLNAYVVSKTRAEQSLWEWADSHGWRDRITTVNPGLVLGPALDDKIGTSLDVVKMSLTGAYPAWPAVGFPVVDVRDVAELHLRAMEAEQTGGRRLIAAADSVTMTDIGRALKEAYPDRARKISTRELPDFMIRLIAVFDRSLGSVLPDLGSIPHGENGYVTELTGIQFRPAAEAIRAASDSLLEHSLA